MMKAASGKMLKIVMLACVSMAFHLPLSLPFSPLAAQSHEGSALSLVREGDGFVLQYFDSHASEAPALQSNAGVPPALHAPHPGAPALPCASTLVGLPRGSRLVVDATEGDERLWPAAVDPRRPLPPQAEGWVKDRPAPEPVPDKGIYGTDAFYRNGAPVVVTDLGAMGDRQLFRVEVNPVAYNPVSGDLRAYRQLTAHLKATVAEAPLRLGPERYLIVSRPEFREGLQPFVRWKRQEGYDVVELYATTHLRDSVRALIRPLFAGATPLAPAPDYLLLVGDAAQLQAFIGETTLDGEGHITDLYYAEHTGDWLPDARLGRWPVNDTAELRVVVEKTLRYEQFGQMDTAQLRRMLLVAGNEQSSPAPLTTNAQVEYVSQQVKLAHPEVDTLCYHNPQSAGQIEAIKSDIRQGASLLNYTAHCTVGGWSSPSLSIGGVEEAAASQPMVYVNNCCKSNSFGGTCFGEQLLRLPGGGAVGVIGATNSTLWYEDYYWAVGPKFPVGDLAYDPFARGAFDALVGSDPTAVTLGDLMTAGNLAVSAAGSSYSRFYWEVYTLFGDPSLRPYITVPQAAALSGYSGNANGSTSLYVHGTPGATVTAMQGDSLLGVSTIDAAAHAFIALSRCLDTTPLVLTLSGAGLIPWVDTLLIENYAWGTALRDVAVGDDSVRCTVENIGTHRSDSLRVVLSQLAEQDTLLGASLAEQEVWIDSLLPGERRTVALPVQVMAAGQHPLWMAELMVWRDGIDVSLDLRHALPTAYPTLTLLLQDAAGNEAQRLEAGKSYQLEATVEGRYDSLLLEAEPYPFGVPHTSYLSPLTFTTPDSLCALRIAATVWMDRWSRRQEYWLEGGSRLDGFEDGLRAHPWQNASRVPWEVDSTVSHSGRYSLRSGAIGDGQTSALRLEVEMPYGDAISFWTKTSTEARYDKLTFYVDGFRRQPEAWGEMNWTEYTFNLTAGRHTLEWRYAKDHATSSGSDCVWIDDVQLPMVLWDSLSEWPCGTAPVGIGEVPGVENHGLSVSPNPATNTASIACSNWGMELLTVTDIYGRVVYATRFPQPTVQAQVDVATLPSGLYFVTASSPMGTATLKLIVTH